MADFVPDYTKLGSEIIIDMINHVNNKSYTSSDVFLNLPQVATAESPHDTQTTVIAIPATAYLGNKTVYWDRLPLDVLFNNSLELPFSGPDDVVDLEETILDLHGIRLTSSDVALTGSSPETYALTADPDSYLVNGSVLVVYAGEQTGPIVNLLAFDGNPLYGFDGNPLMAFN